MLRRCQSFNITLVTLKIACILFAGCTSPKYQLVPEEEFKPPVVFDCIVEDEIIETRLVTLIYYKSPGSWKKQAKWDEYVFLITNLTTEPVFISSILIEDPLDSLIQPGLDPWDLERASDKAVSYFGKYAKAGIQTTFDVRPEVLVGAVMVEGAGLALGAALQGSAALLTLGAFTLVVLPAVLVVGAGTYVKNGMAEDVISEHFDSRRFHFPFTIQPGEFAQGSVFFPIVPSPGKFIVSYSLGDTDSEILSLTVPLGFLDGLHEKPAKGE